MSVPWNPDFCATSPLLAALRPHAMALRGADWPALAALQSACDRADVRASSGWPLRLLHPEAQDSAGETGYEARIHASGAMTVRPREWHDLFNLLMWLAYPKAKAALNARHVEALGSPVERGARGPVRDALTVFDESGVVVVADDQELLDLVREFRWKRLFWQRRDAVCRSLRVLPFGHALCEKALAPYIGLTGHALLLHATAAELALPLTQLVSWVDGAVSHRIADSARFQSTRELSPLPLLGVPGWHADNASESFYDDTGYFRPGRVRA